MHDTPTPRPGWRNALALISGWLPVLLCGSMILNFGSDSFSLPSTSRFLGPILLYLLPGLTPEQLALVIYSIRKAAHVTEYGLLSFLTLRAMAVAHDAPFRRGIPFALTLPMAVALVDESLQAHSATRAGSAWDVLLDTISALLLIGCVHLAQRIWGRPLFRTRQERNPKSP